MAEEAHKEPTMEEILASIRKIISEDDEPRSQIAPESRAQMRTVDPEPVAEAASAPDMALEEDDSMFEEFDLSDITETASEAPAPETPQPSPLDIAEEDQAESAAGDVFEDVELPVIEDEAPGMAVEEEVFDLPELDAGSAPEPEPEPAFAPEPEAEFAPEPEMEVDTVKVEAAPVPTPEMKSESPAEVKMQAALTESSTEAAAAGALARLVAKMDMGSENTLEGMVRELLKPMIKEWLDANLPAIVEDKVEAEVQRIARLAR